MVGHGYIPMTAHCHVVDASCHMHAESAECVDTQLASIEHGLASAGATGVIMYGMYGMLAHWKHCTHVETTAMITPYKAVLQGRQTANNILYSTAVWRLQHWPCRLLLKSSKLKLSQGMSIELCNQ